MDSVGLLICVMALALTPIDAMRANPETKSYGVGELR
jgi:hypothetical protein